MLISLHFIGISSLVTSINLLSSIYSFCIRDRNVNVFLFAMMITSLLLIIILPVLAAALTLLLIDRNLNACFFDSLGGGDLVLFQHLFWFFGHPEVYVIIIPTFGGISLILDSMLCRPTFSTLAMMYSISSIAILGFFVWAHHMFTSGLDTNARSFFGTITIVIGLPTSIKIFN